VDSVRIDRPSKHQYYLKMLDLVASRSTCIRRAVGAIIVDGDGHVLSTGYNGVVRGFDHCVDSPCAGANDRPGETSNCMAVHAEQNALLQCTSLDRARTIYCSCLPCFTCAKLICNTKIDTVICLEDYADHRGLDLMIKSEITVNVAGKVYNG
jgi:dCMP deaminase